MSNDQVKVWRVLWRCSYQCSFEIDSAIQTWPWFRGGKLEAFAEEKETYSQFCVDKVKGTHGLHVSSVSEQNHASTLCHLNDNHSKNNKYCEQPITLVKDLFACQQCHVNITKSLPWWRNRDAKLNWEDQAVKKNSSKHQSNKSYTDFVPGRLWEVQNQ